MLLITNFVWTPRGSRKKPNAVRSPTYHLWTADANSHMPCHAHAALCRGLEKSLSERHGRGMARARHGMCVSNTAALCKSNGKDNLNTFWHGTARQGNGMGAAWYCELTFTSCINTWYVAFVTLQNIFTCLNIWAGEGIRTCRIKM
jgi:hypothetical protein